MTVPSESHPNEELMQRYAEAWVTRDFATIGTLYSDDVVLHIGGRNPLSGDHHGRDDFFELIEKLLEITGASYEVVDVHATLANDEHGVVLASVRAEREDRTLEGHQVVVCHIEDSRIQEVWVHEGDQNAVDEFLS